MGPCPDSRHLSSWLGTGFVHAVSDDYAGEFVDSLRGLGFTVVTIEPRRPEEFHPQLAAALQFPDGHGMNWDAVHDSMRNFGFDHPFALIWRNADRLAAENLKLFAEASAILFAEFQELGRGHGPQLQAELVITGFGLEFRHPERGS